MQSIFSDLFFKERLNFEMQPQSKDRNSLKLGGFWFWSGNFEEEYLSAFVINPSVCPEI
jgi:hypothetical protein